MNLKEKNANWTQWFFPVLGIVLACTLAWGVGFSQGDWALRRESRPTAYADAAKADALRDCKGEIFKILECAYNKVERARATVHDELDLDAQQRSANIALAAIVIGVFTLLLSAVGIYYLKRTLDATLVAVNDSSIATRAMLGANDIARVAQRASFRPVLNATIDGPYLIRHDLDTFRAYRDEHWRTDEVRIGIKAAITVKNIGNAIATIKTRRLYATWSSNRDFELDTYITLSPGESFTFVSNKHNGADKQFIGTSTAILYLNRQNFEQFNQHGSPIISKIRYSDMLGVTREHGVAFKPLSALSSDFEPWGGDEYNYDIDLD